MGITLRRTVGTLVIGAFVSIIATLFGSQATFAATTVDVPLTPTAQASAKNVLVTVTGTDIRVQFDYDLANGAPSATVDIALNDRQSFGIVSVTGPGRYDQTITNVLPGSYSLFAVISGMVPDYPLKDPATGQQQVIVIKQTSPCSERRGKERDGRGDRYGDDRRRRG